MATASIADVAFEGGGVKVGGGRPSPAEEEGRLVVVVDADVLAVLFLGAAAEEVWLMAADEEKELAVVKATLGRVGRLAGNGPTSEAGSREVTVVGGRKRVGLGVKATLPARKIGGLGEITVVGIRSLGVVTAEVLVHELTEVVTVGGGIAAVAEVVTIIGGLAV